MTALERLRAEFGDEAGLLAGDLNPSAGGDRAAELELAVEAVREGYLLHYGAPRLGLPPDPDLALLAGDRLYALGLERLAALGELDAIAELCDVIALSAQAQSAGDADLAAAVWEAGEAALRDGSSAEHRAAKAAAAAGDEGAARALRAAVRQSGAQARPNPSRDGRLDVDDSVPPRLTQ